MASGSGLPNEPIYTLETTFDSSAVVRKALARGFSRDEAEFIASIALQQVRELSAKKSDGSTVSSIEIAEAIRQYAIDEVDKEKAKDKSEQQAAARGQYVDAIEEPDQNENGDGESEKRKVCRALTDHDDMRRQSKRYKFAGGSRLAEHFHPNGGFPYDLGGGIDKLRLRIHHGHVDLITALCRHLELAVELAKHMRPEDILKMYSISRAFHDALDSHLLSSVRQIIAYRAPEAGRVFSFKMYRSLLVQDPVGRRWADQMTDADARLYDSTAKQVRTIPGLRYLQLVLTRDRCCREILALLARHGHRTPPGTYGTLLRIWLVMDVPTSMQRKALMRNRKLWTDIDLYNGQLFVLKLAMHFNDPVLGMPTVEIPRVILGQRGLYFLWQVLVQKRFTTPLEIIQSKVRYDFVAPASWNAQGLFNQHVYGVPFDEVGLGQLEAWGQGECHLMRIDELIPLEAIVRGVELDRHLVHMMTWGYFHHDTGANIVPSEDEMYVSDEEMTLGHMDTSKMWQPKHARKNRWHTLNDAQKQEILDDDDDERLCILAWAEQNPDRIVDMSGGVPEDAAPSLEDEINRGFFVRRPPKHRAAQQQQQTQQPPAADDAQGWAEFSHRVRVGLPKDLSGDSLLPQQADQPCPQDEHDWDWAAWLAQEQSDKDAVAAHPVLSTSQFGNGSRVDGEEDVFSRDMDVGGDNGENEGESADDGDEVVDDELQLWDEEDMEIFIENFFAHVHMEGVEHQ
ncbi:hypothetical protein DCS_02626 [Drechmeria coniospora]|uniref:Histidine kinase group protein n=1 Tax=Drechmeria coniospora TaxID=98403 RepID=A0A151GWL0_DRECN|nr:hypothetical protein DCS_02626 [Drechmeria coniospora]KYK61484.1 hypothetical protein DCS_02626 [Drechmeria coniospora]